MSILIHTALYSTLNINWFSMEKTGKECHFKMHNYEPSIVPVSNSEKELQSETYIWSKKSENMTSMQVVKF